MATFVGLIPNVESFQAGETVQETDKKKAVREREEVYALERYTVPAREEEATCRAPAGATHRDNSNILRRYRTLGCWINAKVCQGSLLVATSEPRHQEIRGGMRWLATCSQASDPPHQPKRSHHRTLRNVFDWLCRAIQAVEVRKGFRVSGGTHNLLADFMGDDESYY